MASVPAIPSWIQAPLFEPVFKQIVPDYNQTKTFKASPALKAGENYATVMLRVEAAVELKGGSSKTISLMLKTPHDNEMVREMMKKHNIFDVESTMYREVVPEFEQLYKEAGVEIKFGPKSYELSIDKPYILLEDLLPREFKTTNRLEGLDMEHTLVVLKKIAQWHAASAVRFENNGPYKPLVVESFFRPESRQVVKATFGVLGKVFLQCAKSYEGNDLYYEELCAGDDQRLDDLFDACKLDVNEFNVLNHGDCWSNNMMFKHDAFGKIKETYLVDYQLPRYGPPAQDLYYFLLSSTKYELKLQQFDYFIKYYHKQLSENLKLLKYSKKIPSLKDLHIMLHKYNPWAFSTCTGVMAAVLLDPTEIAKLDNFVGDSAAGAQFKNQLFSNRRYRKHMEMILPWLYNRGAL